MATHEAPHPVPGILQARPKERVAISFSNAWKWKVKVKSLSHIQHLATPWTPAYQAPPSVGFSRPRVLEWGAIAFSLNALVFIKIYFVALVFLYSKQERSNAILKIVLWGNFHLRGKNTSD